MVSPGKGCLPVAIQQRITPIFQAEPNPIAIAQIPAIHLFAVHKDALAVAQILKLVSGFKPDDGSAAARNAPVVKLQVVARLAVPADQKR